ncbi:hypothetical protein PR048_032055 [Dryococelus australis]|uniref:Uncharacterized protein n=1 Tax=Dryococelus australis TaxID=614101 RepID=A0ABQ9G158_9NEOP|nr:hypothetical protein PR048_032055 [Dryococelus australis]
MCHISGNSLHFMYDELSAICHRDFIHVLTQKYHISGGASVAERANWVQSPPSSILDFRNWESCRTMPLVGGFSRGSPVSSALSLWWCSILTSLHPYWLSRPCCYEPSKSLNSTYFGPIYVSCVRSVLVNLVARQQYPPPPSRSPLLHHPPAGLDGRMTPNPGRVDGGHPRLERQGETVSIPDSFAPGFFDIRIAADDAAGRRVFSRISRFRDPCIPAVLHTHLSSPPSALKTYMLRAAKISPVNPLTPSHWRMELRFTLHAMKWPAVLNRPSEAFAHKGVEKIPQPCDSLQEAVAPTGISFICQPAALFQDSRHRAELADLQKWMIIGFRAKRSSISETATFVNCSRASVVTVYPEWMNGNIGDNRRGDCGAPRAIDI